MVVVHIVLFKFRQDTPEEITAKFLTELKKLKDLSFVLNQDLVVGGPSITTPAARSKGFHFCLLSYHKDRAALEEYQASPEHHSVTSTYMWPFNEDLIRFDFEMEEPSVANRVAALIPHSVPESREDGFGGWLRRLHGWVWWP